MVENFFGGMFADSASFVGSVVLSVVFVATTFSLAVVARGQRFDVAHRLRLGGYFLITLRFVWLLIDQGSIRTPPAALIFLILLAIADLIVSVRVISGRMRVEYVA